MKVQVYYVNFRISSFSESGIYDWLTEHTKMSNGYGASAFEKGEQIKSCEVLNLSHVKGCLYLWSLGIIAASLGFMWEIIKNLYRRKRVSPKLSLVIQRKMITQNRY